MSKKVYKLESDGQVVLGLSNLIDCNDAIKRAEQALQFKGINDVKIAFRWYCYACESYPAIEAYIINNNVGFFPFAVNTLADSIKPALKSLLVKIMEA